MSNIDPELSRKLQTRRSFVDSEGTQYSPSEDQVNERKAQADAAARARAFFQPSQQSSNKPGPRERGGSRVDNELVQKLQERRDVVDSRGSAWQKLPDNASSIEAPRSPGGSTLFQRASTEHQEEEKGPRTVSRTTSARQQLDQMPLIESDAGDAGEEASNAVGDLAGEELALKLQTRRGVVEAEGSAWQRVPQTPRGSVSSLREGVQSPSTVPPSPKSGTPQARSRAGTLDSEGWHRPSLQTPRDSLPEQIPQSPSTAGMALRSRAGTADTLSSSWRQQPPTPRTGGSSAAGVPLVRTRGNSEVVGADSQAALPSELAQRLSARRSAIESGDASETSALDAELAQRLSARRSSFEGEPQGELALRLSARRSLVEDEGSCWQSAPGKEAAAPRILGESRPWAELWGGEETWVCEVWAENLGSWAALEGPLEAQPLVLGLSEDGTSLCFVPDAAVRWEEEEEQAGEEEEVARLVASLPAGALQKVSKCSDVPAVLGLHVASDSAESGASDTVNQLGCYVRFETPEGAASYLAALRRKSSFHAAVVEEPPPELAEPPSMPGESPEFLSAEPWTLPPAPERWQREVGLCLKSGPGTGGFHDHFLQELDELAGFA